jgi:hypothetical protein
MALSFGFADSRDDHERIHLAGRIASSPRRLSKVLARVDVVFLFAWKCRRASVPRIFGAYGGGFAMTSNVCDRQLEDTHFQEWRHTALMRRY